MGEIPWGFESPLRHLKFKLLDTASIASVLSSRLICLLIAVLCGGISRQSKPAATSAIEICAPHFAEPSTPIVSTL